MSTLRASQKVLDTKTAVYEEQLQLKDSVAKATVPIDVQEYLEGPPMEIISHPDAVPEPSVHEEARTGSYPLETAGTRRCQSRRCNRTTGKDPL